MGGLFGNVRPLEPPPQPVPATLPPGGAAAADARHARRVAPAAPSWPLHHAVLHPSGAHGDRVAVIDDRAVRFGPRANPGEPT